MLAWLCNSAKIITREPVLLHQAFYWYIIFCHVLEVLMLIVVCLSNVECGLPQCTEGTLIPRARFFLLLFNKYSVTLVIHVEQPCVEDFHRSQTWGRSLWMMQCVNAAPYWSEEIKPVWIHSCKLARSIALHPCWFHFINSGVSLYKLLNPVIDLNFIICK